MKTPIILALLWLCAHAVFPQIPKHLQIPLLPQDSGRLDFAKLDALKPDLENADIILLGEPAHTPQYYEIKIQLVKYLHEQLGFDVLAFESGFYQMETVNADIKKGEPIATAFESGLFPIWTRTDEFSGLYTYLDAIRKNGDELEITGFDCQVSGYSASRRAVQELSAALQSHGVPFDEKVMHTLQAQFESLENTSNGLTPDFNDASLNSMIKLADAMRPVATLRFHHRSLLNWIVYFTDLYHNKIVEKLRTGTYTAADNYVRDSLMAANTIYLYKELYAGKKIIAWGANMHFANQVKNLETWAPDSKQFTSMGSHLKKHLGDKVFCLAVTTDNNYPHTLEKEFAQKGIEAAWISPQELAGKNFSSCLLGKPASGNWAEVVDGIFYFNSSVRTGHDAGQFVKGKVINGKDHEAIAFASIGIEQTHYGTASDIDGQYFLRLEPQDLNRAIKVSCIGFKTKYVSVRTLLRKPNIYLEPELAFLSEVVVTGKAPSATEILQQAITNIPQNYRQTAFNMEFYAVHTTADTAVNKSVIVESVFSTFYDGYYRTAKKNYKITQKRERGDYFLRERTHGLAQWPMWELAYNDIFSNQTDYQIVIPESLDKIAPKLTGTQLYDGDTVFIIRYNYRVAGTIYISSKDYAIVRHVTTNAGRGYINRTEIIYKKQDGKYFPYVANGDYVHSYKVDGVKKNLKITNRAVLKRVVLTDVEAFEHRQDLWFPKNVAYDEGYWRKYYPER
jgi:erythromycin esterase-like protein